MTLAIQHYALREDLALVGYPTKGRKILTGADTGSVDSINPDLSANFVAAERVPGDLDAIIGRRSDLWVFLSRTFHSDPNGDILRTLDARMQRNVDFRAAGVRVVHYTSLSEGGG
jgi:hypothetical protein